MMMIRMNSMVEVMMHLLLAICFDESSVCCTILSVIRVGKVLLKVDEANVNEELKKMDLKKKQKEQANRSVIHRDCPMEQSENQKSKKVNPEGCFVAVLDCCC